MIESFLDYIEEKNLIQAGDHILLAVSGGIDSMVLLDLFRKTSYQFSVGHIDHNIRSNSSEDLHFIKKYCQGLDIPFYSRILEKSILTDKSNVQALARTERYSKLLEMSIESSCNKIATAHHLDDHLETFIMNFMRGSGLKGLSGIPVLNDKLIRPLLFTDRNEITAYAQKNQIKWCEDESNSTDKYTRNKVRHHIIPRLKEIHPFHFDGAFTSIKNISSSNDLLEEFILKFKRENIRRKPLWTELNYSSIESSPNANTLLFHCIRDFGFNFDQCKQIIQSKSSSEFSSHDYKLLKDEAVLYIYENGHNKEFNISIELNKQYVIEDVGILEVTNKSKPKGEQYKIEHVAVSKEQFPLRVRNVLSDDLIYPLGMKLRRKDLNKYLKDKGRNKLHRLNQMILADKNNQVICVLGVGIDERYKRNGQNENLYSVYWKNLND